MKRVGVFWLVLMFAVGPGQTEEGELAQSEEVVLDMPGGRPVAILLPGAGRVLGEERDGFVKVTLQGWMRVGDTGKIPASIPPAPASSGLSGQIRLDLPSGEARYGAGARVALLGRAEKLERERIELMQEFEKESAELEQDIARLEEEAKEALNSSNNFREAAAQRDRSLATLAARKKTLQGLAQIYVVRMDELFARYQVAAIVADEGGNYSFPEAKAGKYYLLASFTSGDSPHRWYLPLDWSGTEKRVMNLTGDGIGTDPYRAFRDVE